MPPLTVISPRLTARVKRLVIERLACVYGVGMGLWLVWHQHEAMSTRAYAGVLDTASPMQWGVAWVVLAAIHRFAIHINGRAWWTPFLRLAALSLHLFIALSFFLGFLTTVPESTAVVSYGMLVAALAFAAWEAWMDIFERTPGLLETAKARRWTRNS